MKKLIVICIAVFGWIAAPAYAEQGCFQRVYTNSHMSKNKNQTVKAIVLRFEGPATGASNAGNAAGVGAQFRDSSKFYQDAMFCGREGSKVWCSIDCDAGTGVISWKSKNTILLKTKGFFIGAECGSGIDYRRVSDLGVASTTYRLDRVPADKCAGL